MMIVLYVADWNISFHLRAIGINCLGSWNLVFCVTLWQIYMERSIDNVESVASICYFQGYILSYMPWRESRPLNLLSINSTPQDPN